MRARVSRGARTGATSAIATLVALALSACGGGTKLLHSTTTAHQSANGGISASTPHAAQELGFPTVATKNTTRVPGADPVADAAGVAVAVFPSAGAGHPPHGGHARPDRRLAGRNRGVGTDGAPHPCSGAALGQHLAAPGDRRHADEAGPHGSGPANGAQVIRIGAVPSVKGMRSAAVNGSDPYTLAAGIDRFVQPSPGSRAATW